MDKDLPSEILAQIAANLQLKDLNSLLRVSKIAHWKLGKHRSMLAKAKVSINIARDARFPQQVNFNVQQCVPNKKNWMVKLESNIAKPMVRGAKYLKEKLVENFYYENLDHNSVFFPAEGLQLHLQFLLSRVHIEHITMSRLLDDEIEAVTSAVSHSSASIGTVKLLSPLFTQCHQELIVACNPKNLVVGGECSLPDSFYQQKVVQKLDTLSDYTVGQNIIDIFSLSATDLVIRRLSNIDFFMIIKYLQQWTECKREIEDFKAEVKIGITKHEQDTLISLCKPELVRFTWNESVEGFAIMIQRRRDNTSLFVSRRGIEFSMKNPNPPAQ